MVKLQDIGWGIAFVGLVACTTTSAVKSIGGGRYSVSGTAKSGWVDADDAYDAALVEAEKYCAAKAKRMVVDSTSGSATGGGEQMPVNNQRIFFRCEDSKPSEEETPVETAQSSTVDNENNSDNTQAPLSDTLGEAEIGQSLRSKRHDSDRNSTIHSVEYRIAPTLKFMVSLAITADQRTGKFVNIELISIVHGKPLLAQANELTIMANGQATETIAVTWRKDKFDNGFIEHLTGTIPTSEFIRLMNTVTSLEVKGQGVEFAFSSSAIAQLLSFALYIGEQQEKSSTVPAPLWDD